MLSTQTTTSLSLVERAKDNDQQAWQRLVDLYGPLVYRLCRVRGLQANDAADVVQEVFRAAHRGMQRFRHDRPSDSFRGWLLTIAKNKLLDFFRARQRNVGAVGGSDMQQRIQQLPSLDWDESSDGSRFNSNANLARRAIDLVRGDFAEQTWHAFWRTTIDGQGAAEVADALGVSRDVVYKSKSRVLRRLREELTGLMG